MPAITEVGRRGLARVWSRLSTDRVNPILVKELRQGLRGNLFTGALTILQLLLVFFGITALLASSDGSSADTMTGTFWWLMSIPLLLVIPATAAQAIQRERTGQTLELLQITNLSARQIVLGKWLSIMIQAVLIVVTALPYILLRYFLGGVDVWTELLTVASILALSAVLSGIAMGYWATAISPWLKWGSSILLLWGVVPVLGALVSAFLSSRSGTYRDGQLLVFGGACLLLVMFLMLEVGSRTIAPLAENHSSSIRAITWLCLAFSLASHGLPEQISAVITGLAVVILVPVGLHALNEPIHPISSLYGPFTRPRSSIRLLALPLAPGWPGGVVYATVSLLAVPFLPFFFQNVTLASILPWIALAGAVFMPVILLKTLLRRSRNTAAVYLLFCILSAVPLYLWMIATAGGATEFADGIALVGAFLPLSAFALALTADPPARVDDLSTLITCGVSVASVVGAWWLAAREWRRVCLLTGSSATSLAGTTASVSTPPGIDTP